MPLLVDGMDNTFGETYAAWPIRFYAVEADGTLAWVSQPTEHELNYDIEHVYDWLSQRLCD